MPRAERSRDDTDTKYREQKPYATGRTGNGEKKPKHRRKSQKHPADRDSRAQQLKLNESKKKLRDLVRLMQHKKDMNAGERQYKERELSALRGDLETVLHQKKKKDMISRYHMVRFFERRKAERSLKQAQKRAAAAPADATDREVLKDAVHEAEVSLNYTLYHPLEKKYISLYDKKGKSSAESGTGFKSAMWFEVEDAMEKGTLQKLRDQKLCLIYATTEVTNILAKFQQVGSEVHAGNPQGSERDRGQRSPPVGYKDNDSDGGFFEEG